MTDTEKLSGRMKKCCQTVVEAYERDYEYAEVAKARGGVALYCVVCTSKVTFVNGVWNTNNQLKS